jgi:hypothetical protein
MGGLSTFHEKQVIPLKLYTTDNQVPLRDFKKNDSSVILEISGIP